MTALISESTMTFQVESNGRDPIGVYLKSKSKPGVARAIPYGPDGNKVMYYSEPYRGEQTFYGTDAKEYDYKVGLFSDEFRASKIDKSKDIYTIEPQDSGRLILGGIKNAFAPGEVVVDLGSAHANSILQFSIDFPQTTFLGIDSRYHTVKEDAYSHDDAIDTSIPGVYLIKNDWETLTIIPNNSVDTIISHRGLTMHGIYSNQFEDINVAIMSSINRVTKPGAILRFDTERGYHGNDEFENGWFCNFLELNGWKIYKDKGATTVAIKK